MNTNWYCEHGCLIAKRGNCEYLTWSIDQVQGMFFADLLNANRHLSDLLASVFPAVADKLVEKYQIGY